MAFHEIVLSDFDSLEPLNETRVRGIDQNPLEALSSRFSKLITSPFIVPSEYNIIEVLLIGGGAGGGSTGNSINTGGGGGSSGVAILAQIAVTGGESLSFIIGSGGNGGVSPAGDGSIGGSTSITALSGTTTALGGIGGISSDSANDSGEGGDASHLGFSLKGGDANAGGVGNTAVTKTAVIHGESGGGAFTNGGGAGGAPAGLNLHVSRVITGPMSFFLGDGGDGSGSGAGGNASNFGAGGGGAFAQSSSNGGNGSDGAVFLRRIF